MIPKILKDARAETGAISFFIGVMIATILALAVAWPVMDSAINSGSGSSGTLTLSGNVSCGEVVNVTNPAGSLTTFAYNITAGGCTAPSATYVTVTLASGQNTSTIAATNLTTIMNANASITNTMTASNPSTGVATLTYNTHGAAGANAGVVLAETLANGAWSATTLTGGVSDASTMPSAAGVIVDQLPLFLVLVLLMILVKALI